MRKNLPSELARKVVGMRLREACGLVDASPCCRLIVRMDGRALQVRRALEGHPMRIELEVDGDHVVSAYCNGEVTDWNDA